jgi:hypothetical protein
VIFLLNCAIKDQRIKETIEKFKEVSKKYKIHLELINNSIVKLKEFIENKDEALMKVNNDLRHFSNDTNFRSYLKDVSLPSQLFNLFSNFYFKKIVRGLSNDTIIPSYGKELNRTMPKLFKTLPSCRGLSSFYDNLTQTVCFEYMDNYNAFWFSTWTLLLVYSLVVLFGSKLAKLFKKCYSHSEIFYDSFDEANGKSHKKHFYLSSDIPLNQLSSSGSRRIRPIDAYSDKETNNYIFNHNHQQFNDNHTPPPSYKQQPL